MEGSPPLTRGIHSYMAGICYRVRFTPAHAGNTCVHNRTIGRRWVHPRSRREYTRSLTRADLAEGSPPLTRGILYVGTAPKNSTGFTPAHAGNTVCRSGHGNAIVVHPRSRGEYLSAAVQPFGIVWFTPAHAGNTLKEPLYFLTFPSPHPHISFNF